MIKLKSFILNFVIVIAELTCLQSQTYIAPVLGYDFQKVVNGSSIRLVLLNKGFGNSSPLVGINLKQIVFKKFYLHVGCDFTHKDVRGSPLGTGAFDDLLFHYNYIKNQFTLAFYLNDKWKIGAGLSQHIVSNLYYKELMRDFTSKQKFTYNETGGMVILGYKYLKFEIEAYYLKRLSIPLKGDDIHYFYLNHIQSIGLRLSYHFKIFDGFNKKDKVDCPPMKKLAIQN